MATTCPCLRAHLARLRLSLRPPQRLLQLLVVLLQVVVKVLGVLLQRVLRGLQGCMKPAGGGPSGAR